MGLDFTHNRPDGHHCPQWSYTGFNAFRRRLAEEEEFDLDSMDGFGGDVGWDDVITDLKPLLNHSDCDGDISPEDCATVTKRLREVVMAWPWDGKLSTAHDQRAALALATCMEICATNGERLVFC